MKPKNPATYYPAGKGIQKTITIRILRKPQDHSINDELQWFAKSLGLFTLRDKDNTQFRVFIELLKSAKIGAPVSSDELAYRLGLSRGTVMHHVNKLLETGIITTLSRGYLLREPNLPQLLESIKRDFETAFAQLHAVAEEIDDMLGK